MTNEDKKRIEDLEQQLRESQNQIALQREAGFYAGVAAARKQMEGWLNVLPRPQPPK